MKKIYFLLACIALAAISAVFFCLGREYEAHYYNYDGLFEINQARKAELEKTLEDASHMSDFIRCLCDYYEFPENDFILNIDSFEEIKSTFVDEFNVPLEKYVYCY